MNYVKTVKIYKSDDGSKEWADVVFENGTIWRPKLIDLAVIGRIIYEVEDNKYSAPGAKGGEYVRDFLNDALDGYTVDQLKAKYKLTDEYLYYLKTKNGTIKY